MKFTVFAAWFCAMSLSTALWGADPPKTFPLSEEDRKALGEDVQALQKEVVSLKAAYPDVRHWADVEIAAEAIDRSLKHDELDQKQSLEQARVTLTLARSRLDAVQSDSPLSMASGVVHVLGYRSLIDGTAQPYAVGLPERYTADGRDRFPVYVVLHGRSDIQSAVPFIARHQGQSVPPEQTWIQLDVFGRGNNGYRYAGEEDVWEALADVIQRFRVDEDRIVLWGFSMGGAGAWHLGLHHPARWCAVGAGAGFVDFYKYQMFPEKLPWFQDLSLRIYDSTNYVMNLSNVPFVTYAGENDGQLLASTTMRDLAAPLNVPLQVIIGPNTGHKFEEASQRTFMDFLGQHARSGRPKSADRRKLRFTTCTVKYNECDWLRIEEQTIPLDASTVTSDIKSDGTLQLTTENVAALSVASGISDQLEIDDSREFDLTKVSDGPQPRIYFLRADDGPWRILEADQTQEFLAPAVPRKRHGLQGPIDDAFTGAFLCVRGTGIPWSKPHQAYVDWSLGRFQSEFSKWMRGEVRTINDMDLTEAQIAQHHLILFGDPGSNSVIARVIQGLPLQWSQEQIDFGGASYNADLHCVPLIFPNPLNPSRYVVLNSGHTFHERDFRASNAQLYPRLGDAGVLRFREQDAGGYLEEIDTGEIFGSSWEFEE